MFPLAPLTKGNETFANIQKNHKNPTQGQLPKSTKSQEKQQKHKKTKHPATIAHRKATQASMMS